MLIFDRQTGEFASREPELLCSFGITEILGAFIASAFVEVGVGAATAGIVGTGLAGAALGAGAGALGGFITGGDPGRGALFGGLSGGLLSGGGALASNLGVFGDAAGAASGSGSAFGGVASDASNAATYGSTVGEFGSGAGSAGGTLGGISGDLAGGAGAFADTSSALGISAPGAEAFQPQTAFAPGVTSASGEALPGVGVTNPLNNTLQTAGVGAPGAGPGAAAFAPPSGVPLDATSAAQLAEHSGLAGGGTNALGLDVVSQGGAQGTADALGSGTADFLPGQTGSAAAGQAEIAAVQDAGGLAGGSPIEAPSLAGRAWNGIKSGIADAGEFLNSPTGKVAGVGLNVLSLGKDLLMPNQVAGLSQLTDAANTQAALGKSLIGQGISNQAAPTAAATDLARGAAGQGQALSQYLTTGTLPPGVQGSIDQATKDAITAIKAQYAQRGMAGSSAETQDINSAKQRAVSQGANIAVGLLQQGTSLESLSSQIYSSLIGQNNALLQTGANLTGISTNSLNGVLNANIQQNNATNSAIANLSRALAGGSVTNTGTQAAA